jgi:hypothetical protein
MWCGRGLIARHSIKSGQHVSSYLCSSTLGKEGETADRRPLGTREKDPGRRFQSPTDHLPFTRTYVSSTRQLSLVGFRWRRKHRCNSGAYRWTRSPHRDVISVQTPLGKQLLDVAVREGKAQVPPSRQQDDLRLKLTPFEQTANRRVHKEHPTSLSRRDCKVATLPFDGRFSCQRFLAIS